MLQSCRTVNAVSRLLGRRRCWFQCSRPASSSSSSDVMHVPIDQARQTTAQALENLGWDADDAALQAEIMTAAELCGNNQGASVERL